MSTFTTQPSATVRATVLAASLLFTALCLGGVAVSFTRDEPEQTVVTLNTATVSAG